MKFLLLVCTLLFACSAYAQTGIYYDATYRGEGITVYEHENLKGDMIRTVYLYTYGKEQCETTVTDLVVEVEVTATAVCPNSIFPPYNPLCAPVVVTTTQDVPTQSFAETCDLNGQRWFVGSDEILKEDGASIGTMYTTEGIDFPKCVPSDLPFEEDVDVCGEVIEVGAYILRPGKEGGFEMWIESDDKTDPAFNNRYNFDTDLINQEPVKEPK